jgi:hypothetical protein
VPGSGNVANLGVDIGGDGVDRTIAGTLETGILLDNLEPYFNSYLAGHPPSATGWEVPIRFHAAPGTAITLNGLQLYLDVARETGVGLKRFADGVSVSAAAMPVTAAFDGFFYIESDDRAWGLRVVKAQHGVPQGSRVDVSGIMRTGDTGERYLEATNVVVAGTGNVASLGLAGRCLGGVDAAYDPATGAGQQGVPGSVGPNNIGLLVRIWGRVTAAGRGWFYVDDGSNVQDGTGNSGIYVEAPGLALPSRGAYVSVTGISSCDRYAGRLVNVLLPRQQADIVVYQPGLLQGEPSAAKSAASPRSRAP